MTKRQILLIIPILCLAATITRAQTAPTDSLLTTQQLTELRQELFTVIHNEAYPKVREMLNVFAEELSAAQQKKLSYIQSTASSANRAARRLLMTADSLQAANPGAYKQREKEFEKKLAKTIATVREMSEAFKKGGFRDLAKRPGSHTKFLLDSLNNWFENRMTSIEDHLAKGHNFPVNDSLGRWNNILEKVMKSIAMTDIPLDPGDDDALMWDGKVFGNKPEDYPLPVLRRP